MIRRNQRPWERFPNIAWGLLIAVLLILLLCILNQILRSPPPTIAPTPTDISTPTDTQPQPDTPAQTEAPSLSPSTNTPTPPAPSTNTPPPTVTPIPPIVCSTPAIELLHLPPYGSTDDTILRGRVGCIDDPSEYNVAVYIYVNGWWSKPTFDSPLTRIRSDGTWEANIVTGGVDYNATQIAAFLILDGYEPPLARGDGWLSQELYDLSLDYVEHDRPPPTDTFRIIEFSGYT